MYINIKPPGTHDMTASWNPPPLIKMRSQTAASLDVHTSVPLYKYTYYYMFYYIHTSDPWRSSSGRRRLYDNNEIIKVNDKSVLQKIVKEEYQNYLTVKHLKKGLYTSINKNKHLNIY